MLVLRLLPKRHVPYKGIASRLTACAMGMYVAFAAPVNAEDAAHSVRKTDNYRVPDNCPSRDEFLREVRARTSPEAQSAGLSIAQQASVEISVDANIARGRLSSAATEPREVVGATCAEVVQALALVVALQAQRALQSPIDQALAGSEAAQQASDSPDVDAPTPRAPVESHVEAPPAPSAPHTPNHAARSPTRLVRSSLRLVAGPVRLRSSSPTRTARWSWGGGAVATFGTAPITLYGASLFVEHQPISRLPFSLVLATELTPRRTYEIWEESATFQWYAIRANACVAALNFGDRSGLWLCADIVGGFTIATGRSSDRITRGRTVYEAWFSSGPAARLRFGLPTRLSVDLAAALDFPVIRHSTRFSNPDIPVYETGNLAGFLFLQVGYASGGSDRRSAAIAK